MTHPVPARAAMRAMPAGAVTGRTTGDAAGNRFCQGLGTKYQASSAAWMYCAGPQPHGRSGRFAHAPSAGGPVAGTPANVNAATFAEDVSPSGARGYGQSETSIAASGPYVVEAWNDSTGFFSACPSAKEQFTGFGFSNNGGRSFTDLQGLPDNECSKDFFVSDPSVTAYKAGGRTFFYVSSMFDSLNGLGRSFVALDACRVSGSGSRATLDCGQPILTGSSTQCFRERIGRHRIIRFCSFLDKDYLTIDPAHGRLYTAFSEFPIFSPGSTIVASACDLGNPAGGPGPAGGTPAAPVCEHGTHLKAVSRHELVGKPYLTVQRRDPGNCEYEGAYPAADPVTGDVYVGYEHNWGTNTFGVGPCAREPTTNVMAKLPRHCLVLRHVSGCKGPAARVAVPVTSIDTAVLPGFLPSSLPNDFPRVAVSHRAGTVSMVWNDTRFHAAGDILLQSFGLRSLRPVQRAPVVLDTPHGGGLSLMPALRTATADGRLDVSWFSRASVSTSLTSVRAVLGVNPRATRPPASNITITSVPSNWDNDNSDILPNFGDYTDSALAATARKPYVGSVLYIAWTDGRTGVPQPFAAHLPAG